MRIIPLTLALVASNAALAAPAAPAASTAQASTATQPANTATPAAAASTSTNQPAVPTNPTSAPTLEQAVKANIAKWGSDPRKWDPDKANVTTDSGETVFAKLGLTVSNGTDGRRHPDCATQGTKVDRGNVVAGCQDAAVVDADRKARAASAQSAADHVRLGQIDSELAMEEVEVTDAAGETHKVWQSRRLVGIETRLTAVEGRVNGHDGVLDKQAKTLTSASATADAAMAAATTAMTEAGKKVDAGSYATDQVIVANALIALGDRQSATEMNLVRLWDGIGFVAYAAPAWGSLQGGTPVVGRDDAELFAGETLAFSNRGAFGVAGGFGAQAKHFGVMALGAVGVIGEAGNQTASFGGAVYYPWRIAEVMELDLGVQGSYLHAADRAFNTTFGGATSTMEGFGFGPTLALAVGNDGLVSLDVRGSLLFGEANQDIVLALDDGTSRIAGQKVSAFVLSIGGRFGGYRGERITVADVKAKAEAEAEE